MTWANYANTGPFTNNVQPPSLSATFFNNIESFLDQIVSSAAGDANITADGSGVLTAVTAKAVFKSKGGGHTLTDWNMGFTAVSTGGTTITHGIKNASGVATLPSAIFLCPQIETAFLINAQNSTTFNAQVASNCNCWWLALLM